MLLRMMGLLAALVLLTTPMACAQAPAEPSGVTPTLEENPALVRRYAETITPSDLAAHLYVFASDYFEGRETAQRGQKLAATYLAGQYRKLGLEPKGTAAPDDPYSPESYFQPFTLTETYVDRAALTATADGAPLVQTSYSQDEPGTSAFFAGGRAGAVEADLIFAGYGLGEDRLNELEALADLGLRLEGKWVLLLDDEPLGADGQSLLTDDGALTESSASWYQKLVQLYRAGLGSPVGYLIVTDRSPLQPLPFADQARAQAQSLGSLSLPEGDAQASRFSPIYHISSATADALLSPTAKTIAQLQATIDQTLEPVVFDVAGVRVASAVSKAQREVETENVLAYVEGSDPALKNEVVVLSSHYDHVGMDPAAGADTIYNGADDDGSGTVAILEMAEAFAAAQRDGVGPRRSVLFLNVSGEEKGLLGSSFYTDTQPVFPLDKTVANLNIDMIGRYDPTHTGDPDYVYLIGSKVVSEDLDVISHRANDAIGTGLDLNDRFNSADDPNRFYARSDHWNFGKHRIPFVFYFTGTHEDYHGVGDHADKIDYERMARISRLIFATAWEVANQDTRPQISGRGFWDDEG